MTQPSPRPPKRLTLNTGAKGFALTCRNCGKRYFLEDWIVEEGDLDPNTTPPAYVQSQWPDCAVCDFGPSEDFGSEQEITLDEEDKPLSEE